MTRQVDYDGKKCQEASATVDEEAHFLGLKFQPEWIDEPDERHGIVVGYSQHWSSKIVETDVIPRCAALAGGESGKMSPKRRNQAMTDYWNVRLTERNTRETISSQIILKLFQRSARVS